MKIIKYRWFIIAAFVLITILIGKNIPKNTIDGDVSNYIPENIDSKIHTKHIEEIFGGTEILMITLSTDDVLNEETLKRVKNISQEMKKDTNIEKVLSLFEMKDIYSEDDIMYVDPAIKRIPKNEKQREELRSRLKDNSMVYESFVSKDFSKTAIVLVLTEKPNDIALMKSIDTTLQKYPGSDKDFVGGIPMVRAELPLMITTDMQKLMPIAIVIMLIMLLMSFRRWRGMVLPFLVVLISIVFCFGLIPLFGWQLTILSIIIPVMLIAVANDYGIHIITKYQELNTAENTASVKEMVVQIINDLWKPVAITGITTIVGILGLLSHKIIPSKQMGVIVAIGIAYALVASLLFIPSVLSILKKEKPLYTNTNSKKHTMDKLLQKLGVFVADNPKKIIVFSIVFTLISGVGLLFIGVDANPMEYFKKNSPVRVADQVINENFGGTQQFVVLFDGDIKEPELLKNMDSYAAELKKMDGVGNVSCISEVIKEISKALNSPGDLYYDKIPPTRQAVAQYLEMYMMNGDPDDFEKMVDFDYKHAQMIIRVEDASSSNLSLIEKKIDELSKDDKFVSKKGGYSLIIKELGEIMVNGQITSMILAFIAIFILMALLFKSLQSGILGIIPLLLSTLMLFGVMGFLGMKINIASAMLSSILIGIGVDYTIHFLWRYRSELKASNNDYKFAVKRTLETTGRGIVFNAVSVIVGFIVLMVSEFLPIIQFGYLIVFSVFTCLLGAIILVPAICQVWKPKFLER